jgi:hypothetical protein
VPACNSASQEEYKRAEEPDGCVSIYTTDTISFCVSKIDTEKIRQTQQKVILLLHKATSFDPTMGSSSGDHIRIKEIKST